MKVSAHPYQERIKDGREDVALDVDVSKQKRKKRGKKACRQSILEEKDGEI